MSVCIYLNDDGYASGWHNYVEGQGYDGVFYGFDGCLAWYA